MAPQLSSEQRQALQDQDGNPVLVQDQQSQQVYFLVDQQLHERAMLALQAQEDWESIQRGTAQANAGQGIKLDEADQKIREKLGFPPRS